jgi:hypothetical protein
MLQLTKPKFYTRCVNLKDHQSFGVDRTALIQNWTITEPNITAKIIINGIILEPLGVLNFLDGKVFNIPKIREALREIIPMTKRENNLCAIESTLFGTQLLSTEYYRYFPSSCLFDMLFTGDLCVSFLPQAVSGELPQRIAIEETYALSEAQINQRIKSGETLEDIDRKNKDDFISSELPTNKVFV